MKQTAVTALIIVPMVKLYHPPYHHKDKSDDEIGSIAADIYGDALKGFNRDILARAWKRVVSDHKTWGWPAVGEITKACREITDSMPTSQYSPDQEKKFSWEMRSEAVARASKDFMENADNLPLSRRALKEFWHYGMHGLRSYFYEHARLQAQIIAGDKNWGYSCWAWGYNTWHMATSDQVDIDFKKEVCETRRRNEIQIEVSGPSIDWMIKHSANIR